MYSALEFFEFSEFEKWPDPPEPFQKGDKVVRPLKFEWEESVGIPYKGIVLEPQTTIGGLTGPLILYWSQSRENE